MSRENNLVTIETLMQQYMDEYIEYRHKVTTLIAIKLRLQNNPKFRAFIETRLRYIDKNKYSSSPRPDLIIINKETYETIAIDHKIIRTTNENTIQHHINDVKKYLGKARPYNPHISEELTIIDTALLVSDKTWEIIKTVVLEKLKTNEKILTHKVGSQDIEIIPANFSIYDFKVKNLHILFRNGKWKITLTPEESAKVRLYKFIYEKDIPKPYLLLTIYHELLNLLDPLEKERKIKPDEIIQHINNYLNPPWIARQRIPISPAIIYKALDQLKKIGVIQMKENYIILKRPPKSDIAQYIFQKLAKYKLKTLQKTQIKIKQLKITKFIQEKNNKIEKERLEKD